MHKVRIGRDLTNYLSYHFCYPDERKIMDEEYKNGKYFPSLLEFGKIRQKASIKAQLAVIKALKLHHLELDFNPKHPYGNMFDNFKEYFKEARELAEKDNISLSVHLSYSYVTSSVCSPQASHRVACQNLLKKELDIAELVHPKYVVCHGGTIPFWEDTPENKPFLIKALIETLTELAKYAEQKGIILELENNVYADNCFYKIEDCIAVIDEVRKVADNVLFCFDAGHYLTMADGGIDISKLEKVLEEEKVAKYSSGLMHLNGYIPKKFDKDGKQIPGTGTYHPLLHLEESPLKKANIRNHCELNRKIDTKIVVLESAAGRFTKLLNANEHLKTETQFILECFGYDSVIEEFDLNEILTKEYIDEAAQMSDYMVKNGF